MTTETIVRHTADLAPGELAEVRELLFASFTGDDAMTEQDFEHCLGGMHVLLRTDDVLVAHGAVVMRRLLHAGRAYRTGYVEVLAVHPEHRRRGHGRTVMIELERIIRAAYELGALGATDDGAPLYASLGWQVWRGTTSVLAPEGHTRTPDEDGGIHVLPVTAAPDLDGDLACEWRNGDVW